jgi:hypothetical protein
MTTFTPTAVDRNSPAWSELDVPQTVSDPGFTDLKRWRLKVSDGGRHIWHYLRTDEEVSEWPQNTVDKYWLGLDTVRGVTLGALGGELNNAATGTPRTSKTQDCLGSSA